MTDKPLTQKYLDEKIDDVLQAVNFGFEKVNKRIDLHSEQNKLEHEGFKKAHQRLEEKIDRNYNFLDSYVQANEAFKQEFLGKYSQVLI